jgi:mRNA-degrading endonuclease toxin of MazEF toxin-antitoxin module
MKPGEVWQVVLGMVGKVRPCLLLTAFPEEDELALVTILPHTTAFVEIAASCRFLSRF